MYGMVASTPVIATASSSSREPYRAWTTSAAVTWPPSFASRQSSGITAKTKG